MSLRRKHHLALTGLMLALLPGLAHALEWKETVQNLTARPFEPTVTAVFHFTNSTDRTVTIRSLDTQCDCLDATTDQKKYAPGASGTVTAQFTVGDRDGVSERAITVLTDELDGVTRLVLRIEVPAVAAFFPRTLAWKTGETNTEKSVDLTTASNAEINFSNAQATDDFYRARLETIEAGRHYRLHVTPRDTQEAISAAIRVRGQNKEGKEVVLSAYVSVQ